MLGLNFFKEKYIVVFLKKTNSIYADMKRKQIKQDKTTISYNEKTYTIDFTKIAFRNGLKNYICVDVDNNTQMNFQEDKSASSTQATLIDLILSKHIVTQLVSKLGGQKNNMPIMIMILMLCVGIFAGYFLGNVYKFEDVVNYLQNIKLW